MRLAELLAKQTSGRSTGISNYWEALVLRLSKEFSKYKIAAEAQEMDQTLIRDLFLLKKAIGCEVDRSQGKQKIFCMIRS